MATQLTLNDGSLNSAGALKIKTNGTTEAVDISTGQVVTLVKDAVVNGLTVGKGGGSVANNTVVGNGALAASSGGQCTAVGNTALASNTGTNNTAVGTQALTANTSGINNDAFGYAALYTNTTGNYNTAIGGYNSGSKSALFSNTIGSYNIAVGNGALQANTTASYNTAVGYRAGYSNATSNSNTFIGTDCGYSTTGDQNTFVGKDAGYYVSTGTKNTIIGKYTGNQGGLDIRTASNKVVLSDGDGNPVFVYGAYTAGGGLALASGYAYLGLGGTGSTGTGGLFLNGEASSGFGPILVGATNGTNRWYAGSNSWIKGGTTYDTFTVQAGTTNGVNLTNGSTSWASASDARLKNVTGTYTNALADIAQIEAVKFTWKADEEAKPQVGVIAQSVQGVVPEAIETIRVSKEDETDYLSVRYTELIPLLVASIQELKAEIDTLKGQA